MRYVYIIMFVFTFLSCQDKNKEAMLRLVKEWDGKEIKFPARSVFTIQGKDTVDFDFKDADYKVVTYVDTIGCTSCKLQLPRWIEFMEELETQTKDNVSFVFVFHPKSAKELRHTLRLHGFNHPVFFDEKDDFNALNRFPDDMMFQTFLLDKDNKVVALGNPIHNPNVKDLYIKHLTGKDLPSKSPITEVTVSEPEHHFETFSKDEIQEHTFLLTNRGDAPLFINHVASSCGCTRVEYDKRPVPPSGTAEIKVTYEADNTGYFKKAITVHCNTENSPLILTIWGEAKE